MAMLLLAVMFAGSGCGTSGLSFLQDDRVHIVTPSDRSDVSLPLAITWTVADFGVGPGAGSFGIVVDRTPPAPGETLASMFSGTDACRSEAECGDASFLAQRNVYTTQLTTLTFDRLPRGSSGDARNRHEITIVLLDRDGRRVGEGAWAVQVDVRTNRP